MCTLFTTMVFFTFGLEYTIKDPKFKTYDLIITYNQNQPQTTPLPMHGSNLLLNHWNLPIPHSIVLNYLVLV